MPMSSLTLPSDVLPALEAFTQALPLPGPDLLLLGDGSGTVYSQPAGWACTAYDHRLRQARLHVGALSSGTNNFAELFPYLQALWLYHQTPGNHAPVNVHIVSDSEVTVRCGNSQYARRANGPWWAALAWFEEQGYRLQWQHVARNSTPWNQLADLLAGRQRRLLVAELPAAADEACGWLQPTTSDTALPIL
jgi:ribonuclease HI